MGTVELFFLGLGLSMDAAAVSISNTLAYPHLKWKAKLSMPLLFALFQGIMPILGYYASGIFATFIDTYAGFVTFFILCFIGGKMIIKRMKLSLFRDIPGAREAYRPLPPAWMPLPWASVYELRMCRWVRPVLSSRSLPLPAAAFQCCLANVLLLS